MVTKFTADTTTFSVFLAFSWRSSLTALCLIRKMWTVRSIGTGGVVKPDNLTISAKLSGLESDRVPAMLSHTVENEKNYDGEPAPRA